MDDVRLRVVQPAAENLREHTSLAGDGVIALADTARDVGGAPPVPQAIEDMAVHGWRSVRAQTAIEPGSLRRMSEPGSTTSV